MQQFFPFSQVGQVQGEVERLRSEVNRKAESHEVSAINSKLGSLERSIREISSEVDGFRYRIEMLEENRAKLMEHCSIE